MENRDFSDEFEFIFSRSSGAGGQNVNKVNTKVELRFNIDNSNLLTTEEKMTLKEKLKTKINSENILQIVSQSERSQLGNREKCVEKFNDLIYKALKKNKIRKKVGIPKQLIEKRLKEKRLTSEKKQNRNTKNFSTDI